MLTQFRSYQLAVKFYRDCRSIKIPTHLKSQLERAASGIALCLAEGYGRKSFQDKNRFYQMSLGSVRECQAIFHLADVKSPVLRDQIDHLGAAIYKLTRWTP